MAIHENFKRIIMLLVVYLFVASWIQINYQSDTGAVYIAMGLISLLVYALAEQLGLKDVIKKLIGIDDNWAVDGIIGLVIGFAIIVVMEVSFVTMGYPAAIYPQTAFAEKITMLSTLVVIGFLAPVGEEIAFRGVFIWFAWQNLKFFTVAVILSSAAFAAFHYTSYGASLPSAYVGAFLIGTLLAILATQTKSLLPGIIVHAMINISLFLSAQALIT